MTQIRFLAGPECGVTGVALSQGATRVVVLDRAGDLRALAPRLRAVIAGATAVVVLQPAATPQGEAAWQAPAAAVPVYVAAAAPEPAAVGPVGQPLGCFHALAAGTTIAVAGLTVTAVGPAAWVVADDFHAFGFVTAAAPGAATLQTLHDRRLAMLVLAMPDGATPERLAVCRRLAPRFVVPWLAPDSAKAAAALEADPWAEVLEPEPGLYYSLDAPQPDD
ncbi:hypothetical protein [Lacticaseibacillus parakribbianus]|uniref:hypothetical protein n=1 Tax=Lacticaseibacillus parakribbianus TaxID=2970927 RepID=UPI0021CB7319|nr:hypothetical protein [Lacticaseibacillus parakribbianus]